MKPPSRTRADSIVYPIGSPPLAYHVRYDEPSGKRMEWRSADGTLGLRGAKLRDFPLYAAELVGDAKTIWVTEGEKACDALLVHDIPAVATTCGAASTPSAEALLPTVAGLRLLLFPDHDEAGWSHMERVGQQALKAGASAVRLVAYRPTLPEANWSKGTDAADLFDGWDSETVRLWLRWFAEEWGVRVTPDPVRPKPLITVATPAKSEDFGSVSDALREMHGLDARPGKNVKCPKHDDRSASLHVLPDDERAVCHAGLCVWSGRGVIAGDIRRG